MENSNEVIAEFMGWNIKSPTTIPTDLHLSNLELDNGNIIELKYHTSWDWLMPVANEIIKSRDEQNADWDLTDLKYALQTTNIDMVYKAVVKFIKEYEANFLCGSCGEGCSEYTYSEDRDVDECNNCKTYNDGQ